MAEELVKKARLNEEGSVALEIENESEMSRSVSFLIFDIMELTFFSVRPH